jgi:hypothetical protein
MPPQLQSGRIFVIADHLSLIICWSLVHISSDPLFLDFLFLPGLLAQLSPGLNMNLSRINDKYLVCQDIKLQLRKRRQCPATHLE